MPRCTAQHHQQQQQQSGLELSHCRCPSPSARSRVQGAEQQKLSCRQICKQSWMSWRKQRTAAARVSGGSVLEPMPGRVDWAQGWHVILCTGHVMVRQAPADIPKNGKKYHIHTFGCQVSASLCRCRNAPRPRHVSSSTGQQSAHARIPSPPPLHFPCLLRCSDEPRRL